MKLDIRSEIKSYIVREGKTMNEVVTRMVQDYGWSWLESMELARVARARVKNSLTRGSKPDKMKLNISWRVVCPNNAL